MPMRILAMLPVGPATGHPVASTNWRILQFFATFLTL
jgi:hypothetical protein